MNLQNHAELKSILGIYFHQDMDIFYSSTHKAVQAIIHGRGFDRLLKLITQIDDLLMRYPDEEKLSDYIENVLRYELNVEFPTYKEFLLYLKNEFQKHIDSQPKDETKK